MESNGTDLQRIGGDAGQVAYDMAEDDDANSVPDSQVKPSRGD
jgi:hypothetical protein